jgi:hypothetical protein
VVQHVLGPSEESICDTDARMNGKADGFRRSDEASAGNGAKAA